jgi:hypothetical protein
LRFAIADLRSLRNAVGNRNRIVFVFNRKSQIEIRIMTNSLLMFPAKAPVRRRRKGVQFSGPPAGPMLVGVSYEASGAMQLRFDRAVDVSGADTTKIVVSDASLGQMLRGTGAAGQQTGEDAIVFLEPVGPSVGTGVRLSASVGNGIVAIDNGGAWAGVSDVEIPFD